MTPRAWGFLIGSACVMIAAGVIYMIWGSSVALPVLVGGLAGVVITTAFSPFG